MTDIPEKSPGDPNEPGGPTDPQTEQPDDVPEIEDSNAPESVAESTDEILAEDDPELLDGAARSLEMVESDDAPSEEAAVSAAAKVDDSSDTGTITDDAKPDGGTNDRTPDWSNERSAHRIAVELKRVETDVRRILENYDTRRKRRLAGTRRWLELEEDIISWRFTGRPDEETLGRLSALVAKRHHLFKQLEFLTTIRPGWRSQPA